MSANYLGNGYIKPMDTIVCPAQTDCPGYVCALDGVCGTDACLTAGCAVNSCGIDILSKLKEHCDNNNISFHSSVITNGTLLTEDIVCQLEKYNCIHMQLTLDGMKALNDNRRPYKTGAGSFDDIISAIQLLLKHKTVRCTIRINVDKTNIAVKEGGANLSGGERLKICLMRELIKDPDILILDEPTSFLDSNSKNIIKQILRDISNNKIIIIITHDSSLLEIANDIVNFPLV